MARYNEWQNRSIYTAADGLSDAERRADRGVFFGSIHRTLSHILWADQLWMSRFAGTEKPLAGMSESAALFNDWEDLKSRRAAFDAQIVDWTAALSQEWLGCTITWYSGLYKSNVSRPAWVLVTHLFNHQTHHRGQVHAMLTAAGAKPDDTDLMLMDI